MVAWNIITSSSRRLQSKWFNILAQRENVHCPLLEWELQYYVGQEGAPGLHLEAKKASPRPPESNSISRSSGKKDDNPHLSSSRHILPLQSHPRVYIDSRPPRPHVLLNGSTMSCNLHIRGGSKSYVQGSIDVFIISSPPSQALPLASHQLAPLQLPGLSIGVCPP